MTLKLYDWQCSACDVIHEELIEVARGSNAPQRLMLDCDSCGATVLHARLPSLTAEYLGEKVRNRFNPRIFGGKHDTEGCERLPSLPDIPGEREADAEARKIAHDVIASGGTPQDARAAVLDGTKQLKADVVADHLMSKEWTEAKEARDAVRKRNRVKKLRSKLIDKGETTIRDTPVPGDSKALKQGAS